MLLLPILLAAALDGRGTRVKAQAQGRLREALGLDDVRIEVLGGEGWAAFQAMRDRERIGFLVMHRKWDLPDHASSELILAEAARTAFGVGFTGWFSVDESRVDHRYRGRGIGTRLYEAALAYASNQGGALVSENVYGGDTSEYAAEVWTRLLLRFEGGWGDLPEVYARGFWAIHRLVAPERRPVLHADGRLVGPGERFFEWRR